VPIEAIVRPILETVLDAVVVMGRDGVIRAWNRHAEAIFGWTAQEAVGRNLGELIVPPELRSAHEQGLARFNQDGVARVLDTRLELSGLKRDGSQIPVELSITLVSREGRDAFVGFLRDISERRRAEEQLAYQVRESRLMLDLSEQASRATDFDETLVATLDAICELADWPVGHAFLIDESSGALSSAAWSSGAREIAPQLVDVTEHNDFAEGLGLPAQVLETGDAAWVSQLDEARFPRRGLGFDGGFAFPVRSGGRCIAVLEFFSRQERPPEAPLLLSARAIGTQIGRVFERARAEQLQSLLVNELDHRARNMLSVVRGIAHLSFGSAADMEQAQRTFDARLDAIANANAILHQNSGNAALLSDVVRESLIGCGAEQAPIELSGPDLCINSSTAIMVSLAVHELCTNAFKYGALSQPSGAATLRWTEDELDESRFDLEWRERGGPRVVAPSRRGFGMRILQRGIELETGGKAEVRYEAEGLIYRLRGARHDGRPPGAAKAA
jgi:PAS domain S-box-containing protein